MLLDLIDLLAEKRFSHPSRITSTLIRDDSVRFTVDGYGWWKAAPGYEDRAMLTFHGISSGTLNVAALLDVENDEALEDFEIVPTQELSWALAPTFSLYCSQALSSPLAVYDVIERWVERSRGVKSVGDFLHGAVPLSRFLKDTRSNFFLLARGPEDLRAPLRDELVRQKVRHQFEPAGGYPESGLFVRLSRDAWFFCEQATLEPL